MHRRLQLQPLSYDRHEHVRAYGDPDLALDGILRGTEERLDPQVLLDPFEEQLSGNGTGAVPETSPGPFPAPPHRNCS